MNATRIVSKMYRKTLDEPNEFDEEINGISELRAFIIQDKYIKVLFDSLNRAVNIFSNIIFS